MRNKPWPIIVLAIFHFVSPIGNILVNSYRWNITPSFYTHVLLHPKNLPHLMVLVILPIVAGFCVYFCRKWTFFLYMILMFIAMIYSFMTMKGAYQLQNFLFVGGLYFVNILLVGYFMLGNVRKLYFNPRVRWWESAPRFATDFQARILNKGTDVGNGQIKNISVGGFFIEMSESLEEHQEVSIEFIHGDQKIEVLAMPVFHRESNPRGYGFKIHAGHSRKSGMLKLVKKMKSEGALVMGRAPTPEDSFGHWLRKAFRSPDAWVPKSRE